MSDASAQAINELRGTLNDVLELIKDDAYAATFQTMGQYRQALIDFIKTSVHCSDCLDLGRQVDVLKSMLDLAVALRQRDAAHARNRITSPA